MWLSQRCPSLCRREYTLHHVHSSSHPSSVKDNWRCHRILNRKKSTNIHFDLGIRVILFFKNHVIVMTVFMPLFIVLKQCYNPVAQTIYLHHKIKSKFCNVKPQCVPTLLQGHFEQMQLQQCCPKNCRPITTVSQRCVTFVVFLFLGSSNRCVPKHNLSQIKKKIALF